MGLLVEHQDRQTEEVVEQVERPVEEQAPIQAVAGVLVSR